MAEDVKRSTQDPHAAMLWEAVLTQRAKRRLVEFELLRRRTLLALSVVFAIVGVALAFMDETYVGAPFAAGAVASGAAALPRRDAVSGDRQESKRRVATWIPLRPSRA